MCSVLILRTTRHFHIYRIAYSYFETTFVKLSHLNYFMEPKLDKLKRDLGSPSGPSGAHNRELPGDPGAMTMRTFES
jgi:hypothetical protein